MTDTEPIATEQAQPGQAQATGTQATATNTKTGFSKGAKALIGGAAVATAGYLTVRGFKRFIWPEKGKFKRGIQILLMGGTFYWATHCGSVNAKIADFYNGKLKPTVIEMKTGREKISSLEQKAQALEQSKVVVDANYQKTQEALKAESEKTKKLDVDYKIEKEKSKGLASTLKEREARLQVKDEYISDLERQVREGMKKVDEERDVGYTPATQAPALEERTVANYPSDSGISASGYKIPDTLSKLESKLASNFSYIIYVDKDENKLSLYQSNDGKLDFVKRYNCSTGINPGRKMREGDKATPEGIFFAEFRNFSPNLTGLYGAGIVGLTGNFRGIVLCGARYHERIEAIRQGDNITNGGVIMEDPGLVDLDSRVGSNFSNVAFVLEHSSRPIVK